MSIENPITDKTTEETYSSYARMNLPQMTEIERKQSVKIDLLAKAYVKAQAEFDKAFRDKVNPHLRSQYADIEQVIDAIRGALSNNGLSFIQETDIEYVPVNNEMMTSISVETIILHESAQHLRCGPLKILASKLTPQNLGSALTYLRKYSLKTAFGIPDTDDDGESGNEASSKQEPQKQSKQTSDAPKTKPPYPDANFEKNLTKWEKSIMAGKINAGEVVKTVGTTYLLSETQLNKLDDIQTKYDEAQNASQ